jgi:hypothetical protein
MISIERRLRRAPRARVLHKRDKQASQQQASGPTEKSIRPYKFLHPSRR